MPLRQLLAVARHPISQNALSLYAVQFVLTILPLVTLPWLAHALGPSELGIVVFVQTFSFVLGNLPEYGFGLSATRQVARERQDPEALARTVAGVLGAKLALTGVAAVGALVALVAVPQFREDPRLAAFGLVMATLQGFNTGWFFIGIERVRLMAAIDVFVRLLTTVAIVLLVHDSGDGLFVLWIWTSGAVVSVGLTTTLMYRRVAPLRPAWPDARTALRTGWPLFVSTAAVVLYTSGTVVILGLLVTSAQLALFSAAERLARAAIRSMGPVATATFPRVTFLLANGDTARAQRLALLSLLALLAVGLAMAAALILLAPQIVAFLFGPKFSETTPILRVFALLIPLSALAQALTGLWLLPRGHDLVLTRISVGAGIAIIGLTLVIGSSSGVMAVAWILVSVEACIVVTVGLFLVHVGVLPGRAAFTGR